MSKAIGSSFLEVVRSLDLNHTSIKTNDLDGHRFIGVRLIKNHKRANIIGFNIHSPINSEEPCKYKSHVTQWYNHTGFRIVKRSLNGKASR